MIKIGYQGNNGTFSEIAVINYFKDKEYEKVGFKNFKAIFNSLMNKEIDYALIPVENTTTGIISRTYDLFKDYDINVVGEIKVKITQDLIGIKGCKIDDIKEVYSHPEALSQCSSFFESHPNIQNIPYQDTAKSVEYIKECHDVSKAAIGSWRACEYYGMECIKENIQDEDNNITRFLVITNKKEIVDNANKISMMIILKHQPGSLYNALGILAKKGINLLKLESRPLPHKVFEYLFYIDIDGNLNDKNVKEAIDELKMKCDECVIFGNYVSDNS